MEEASICTEYYSTWQKFRKKDSNDDDDDDTREQKFHDNEFEQLFVLNNYSFNHFQELEVAIAKYESNSGICLRIGR
jgi:hypothetical protein